MIQEIEYLGKNSPDVFQEALREEGFLEGFLDGSVALEGINSQIEWFRLKDESGDFAFLAQFAGPDPKVATIWLFLQRKGTARELRPEFREFGQILWNLWFKELGYERVQAFVPLSKLKHIKLLSSWRFQEETRMNGIRKGMRIGGRWHESSVMGLVDTDLPIWWRKEMTKGE